MWIGERERDYCLDTDGGRGGASLADSGTAMVLPLRLEVEAEEFRGRSLRKRRGGRGEPWGVMRIEKRAHLTCGYTDTQTDKRQKRDRGVLRDDSSSSIAWKKFDPTAYSLTCSFFCARFMVFSFFSSVLFAVPLLSYRRSLD